MSDVDSGARVDDDDADDCHSACEDDDGESDDAGDDVDYDGCDGSLDVWL